VQFIDFILAPSSNPAQDSPRLGVIERGRLTDLTEAGRQGALSIDPAWSLLDVLRSDAGLGGLVERVHAVGPSILEPFALDDSDVRVLAPVSHPEKVIGIGLNYHDHAEETGMAKPSEPFLFAMYPPVAESKMPPALSRRLLFRQIPAPCGDSLLRSSASA
jgi:hypothetical protein